GGSRRGGAVGLAQHVVDGALAGPARRQRGRRGEVPAIDGRLTRGDPVRGALVALLERASAVAPLVHARTSGLAARRVAAVVGRLRRRELGDALGGTRAIDLHEDANVVVDVHHVRDLEAFGRLDLHAQRVVGEAAHRLVAGEGAAGVDVRIVVEDAARSPATRRWAASPMTRW